jgi:hypothetical protein
VRCTRALFLAAFAVCLSAPALTAECQENDAKAFLEANGLEQLNARSIDYVAHLVQNRPEKAAEIHVEFFSPQMGEKAREDIRGMATRAAAMLTKFKVEDVELVAAHRLSSKSVGLCYILNTDRGAILLAFGAYRHDGNWYGESWDLRMEFREIAEYLRGAIRFREPASFPVEPKDETTV